MAARGTRPPCMTLRKRGGARQAAAMHDLAMPHASFAPDSIPSAAPHGYPRLHIPADSPRPPVAPSDPPKPPLAPRGPSRVP
eukprot:357012-Chlamydomonas_euryale.AAC.7